ncbi:MAG: SDR family NAD(P)-dependent oxidoreductase [Deltaproteobacteria bacterium]|nr:SDR family NAD(P)-dependent oxidoreductase [Deltaproteobacteria bacterium]
MGIFDRLLDASIYYSFDRTGFLRHQRAFHPEDLQRSMAGKVCLVTGANSGLGLAVARGLAGLGARVHLLCRSAERGEAARQALIEETGNGELHLEVIDLASPASIRAFAAELEGREGDRKIDVLVHNAGLLPPERELTEEGLELTLATHVVGPFLLNHLLRERLASSRVIYVSSGGMYARRLDLEAMRATEGPYDGVVAYAHTKRAQVVQAAQWAEVLRGSGTTVNAMHPGWAATPGVERSLPAFYRFTKKRLRTAEEGADTALWLAVAERVEGESGKLFFDRRVVSPYLLPGTREAPAEREALWRFCEEICDVEVRP